MSPFTSTVFPSENMTKIFKIGNEFENEKQDLQCAHSRGYLSTTTTPLVLTNTEARPLINYLETVIQNPTQLL